MTKAAKRRHIDQAWLVQCETAETLKAFSFDSLPLDKTNRKLPLQKVFCRLQVIQYACYF